MNAPVCQGKPERFSPGYPDNHPLFGKNHRKLSGVTLILNENSGHTPLVFVVVVHVEDQPREVVVEDPFLEVEGGPRFHDVDQEFFERGVSPGKSIKSDKGGGNIRQQCTT